jgi:hypothetical protein
VKLRDYARNISEATIATNRRGEPVVIFQGEEYTAFEAKVDRLEIYEATAAERDALRAAGFEFSSERADREREIFPILAAEAGEDLEFHKDQAKTDSSAVVALLRAAGRRFSVCDVRAVDPRNDDRSVDVRFDGAAFQVRTVFADGRRLHAELKAEQRHYSDPKTTDFLLTPATKWPVPIPHDELARLVAAALDDKARHYAPETRAGLDALVYVNSTREIFLDSNSAMPSASAVDVLRAQGWRSTSVVIAPYAHVVFANEGAPAWLRELAGQTRNEWVRGGPRRRFKTLFALEDAEP